MYKIYIEVRDRNVLFILGAYSTARLNNKKSGFRRVWRLLCQINDRTVVPN